eukprot:1113359-Amorphochlora_amoeboformis.AAC.1
MEIRREAWRPLQSSPTLFQIATGISRDLSAAKKGRQEPVTATPSLQRFPRVFPHEKGPDRPSTRQDGGRRFGWDHWYRFFLPKLVNSAETAFCQPRQLSALWNVPEYWLKRESRASGQCLPSSRSCERKGCRGCGGAVLFSANDMWKSNFRWVLGREVYAGVTLSDLSLLTPQDWDKTPTSDTANRRGILKRLVGWNDSK